MGLAGKVGAVFVQTSAASATFTDEATTKNGDYTRYQITNAAKRYWDKSAPVTVKKNGSTITTGFVIEYAGGVIVFTTPLIVTDTVVVSGKNWTVAQVGGFFNWSLDVSMDVEETPAFGDTWKSVLPTLAGFSGSAEKYWGDKQFFDLLGTEIVLVLYVDSATSMARYEGYAVISGDGIETPADGIINETIDFQGNGQLYYRP